MFGTSTPRCPSRLSSPEWKVSSSKSVDDSGVDLSSSSLISSSTSSSSFSSSSSLSCSRSIGRRCGLSWWVGRERLDILRLLQDINAAHLLKLLGSYLGGKELLAMSLVSKTWNTLVQRHFHSIKTEYLLSIKSDYENSGIEELRRQRSTPRKAMSNVSNFSSYCPSTSVLSAHGSVTAFSSSSAVFSRSNDSAPSTLNNPPISPSKMRHRLFTEEASKLSPGECLQSCPRCTNPSRVIPSESRATCSRISCGFEFCTKCMCSAHLNDSGVCRTPTKSSGKALHRSIVSTKKSRRRLKRL